MKFYNILRIRFSFFLLLAVPGLSFSQVPNLGTAANFVLFTSVGAVTNTGISHLTGNVGSNSGTSTGFGNVNGQMHDNDGATAQASADLLTAYNQLNSTIATFFPAPLLGNGDTLEPGVYSIAGATTLNLNLYLDALGNPNAVFIFKIQGPLSTNAASKIKLINGAKACNVFWKVEGLVSMASGTSMKGNVIANNAAIEMSAGDTLEGRALSTAGAVTMNGLMGYTPIGCGSPYLTGPAAPALASVGCYALFSGNGPVSNVGVTNVTGDVGTNVGLTTGFNPLFVNGAIHPIADGSTAAAAADLLNVYNYLNLTPVDINLLYPAQFGNNLVLTPHTYSMNGAVTFTDSLFLDGMGNADAVFMIKINGAMQTSTYSKVILVNGTQSKNIYWMVNGAVDINNYSEFKGTLVANNGAISLNTGASFEGRMLTTNGAFNTAAITITMPAGCGSCAAPAFSIQPVSSGTLCAPGSLSFTARLYALSDSSRWFVSSDGGVNWSRIFNGGNYSGATSATLTITANSYAMNNYQYRDSAYNCNPVLRAGSAVATLSIFLDVSNPLISCPGNVVANTDFGLCSSVVNSISVVSATDNCGTPVVTYTVSGATGLSGNFNASGVSFNKGLSTVTYIATDATSRTATCSFSVTIEDNEDPTLTCPANRTVSTDLETCSWNSGAGNINARADDNCSGLSKKYKSSGATVILFTRGNANLVNFNVGTSEVTYKAIDASGNHSRCSFTITVIDTRAPGLVCPNNLQRNTNTDACSWTSRNAVISFETDNCSAVSKTYITTGASNYNGFGNATSRDFAIGTSTIVYTATDGSGNTSTCSFNLTIIDNQGPNMVCNNRTYGLNAQGNKTLSLANINSIGQNTNDACSAVTFTAVPSAFNCANVGANNVRLTGSDASGNTSTCTAVVTITTSPACTAFKNQNVTAAGIAEVAGSSLNAYPNPFSTRTTLSFSIAESQGAKLVVFSLTGTEIMRLFEGQAQANKEYKFDLIPDGLSDGMYFAKLILGSGEVQIQKIILQR